MQSQYALEYLKHKFTAQTNVNIFSNLYLNLSYRYQERMGNYQTLSGEVKPYGAYSLLDARLSWKAENYQLYVEANNLLDKTYYDYGNVPQPGCWIMAGATLKF